MISRNSFNIRFKHNIINTGEDCYSIYKNRSIGYTALPTYEELTVTSACKKFKCTKCGMEVCGYPTRNKNKFKFRKVDVLACDEYLIKQIIE